MTTERATGRLQLNPPGVIADRCARVILEYASPRAVTLDPDGRVWVEPVEAAAEIDLVGVYAPALGLLELSRRVQEDLRFVAGQRELLPVLPRRVVGRPRQRREAA
jgi:hypothetical protein